MKRDKLQCQKLYASVNYMNKKNRNNFDATSYNIESILFLILADISAMRWFHGWNGSLNLKAEMRKSKEVVGPCYVPGIAIEYISIVRTQLGRRVSPDSMKSLINTTNEPN